MFAYFLIIQRLIKPERKRTRQVFFVNFLCFPRKRVGKVFEIAGKMRKVDKVCGEF